MNSVVVVSGLRTGTLVDDIQPLFLNCGEIIDIVLNSDEELRATIVFRDEEGAIVASMLDGCLLRGSLLSVRYDSDNAFNPAVSAEATGTLAFSSGDGTENDIQILDAAPRSRNPAASILRIAKNAGSGVLSSAGNVVAGVKNVLKNDEKQVTDPKKEEIGEAPVHLPQECPVNQYHVGGYQPQW